MKQMVISLFFALMILLNSTCNTEVESRSIDLTRVISVGDSKNVHEKSGLICEVRLEANDEKFSLEFKDIESYITVVYKNGPNKVIGEFRGSCEQEGVTFEIPEIRFDKGGNMKFFFSLENVTSQDLGFIEISYLDNTKKYELPQFVLNKGVSFSDNMDLTISTLTSSCE